MYHFDAKPFSQLLARLKLGKDNSLDFPISLIDQMLPIELIIYIFDLLLPEETEDLLLKEEAMLDRQKAMIRRRAICHRYRLIFPQLTDYVITTLNFDKLNQMFMEDAQRAAEAKSIMIYEFKGRTYRELQSEETATMVSMLPNLESLIIFCSLSAQSTQLATALSGLKRLKKVNLFIHNLEENDLVQIISSWPTCEDIILGGSVIVKSQITLAPLPSLKSITWDPMFSRSGDRVLPLLLASSSDTLTHLKFDSCSMNLDLIATLSASLPLHLTSLAIGPVIDSYTPLYMDTILSRLTNLVTLNISKVYFESFDWLLTASSLRHVTFGRLDADLLEDLSSLLKRLHLSTLTIAASGVVYRATKHPIIRIAKEAKITLIWDPRA